MRRQIGEQEIRYEVAERDSEIVFSALNGVPNECLSSTLLKRIDHNLQEIHIVYSIDNICLLYTSDAADE